MSSVVEALMSSVVEALNFASVADGFLGAIVVAFRILFVVVCEGSFYSERLCRTPVLCKVCSLVVCCFKTSFDVVLLDILDFVVI